MMTLETFSDNFGQVVLLWQRLRRPILENEHVTPADKRILYGLFRVQEITKRDLAKIIVLEHSSLTRSLDRLVSQGLVARKAASDDKRYIKLSLTETGRKKVKRIRRRSLALLKEVLPNISEQELKQIAEFFGELKASMEGVLNK